MSELLTHICKCQSLISNLPIKLYFHNNLMETFDPYLHILDIDLSLPYLKELYNTDKKINYCITPDLLIMGLVQDNSSPYSIVVGPALMGKDAEPTARKLITSGEYPLKLDQLENLARYLSKVSDFDFIKFTHLLSLLNTYINNEIIPTNTIISTEIEYNIEEDVETSMLEKDEEINCKESSRRNPLDFDSEMLYCIKHGLTERLKKLTTNTDASSIGVLGLDTLRHYKNALIMQNSLSVRAAIAGGLNPETSYQLGEIYIHKIESCTNLNELLVLSPGIRVDYCERVRELQYPKSDNPTINQAMHYINENIHKRITVEEIAKNLSISKGYLSTMFKKTTKDTIPEYINKQKITEAKRLLRLTNKPLTEISEYLSFSSQSHFQNTFKKYEKMTPLDFRNSNKDLII